MAYLCELNSNQQVYLENQGRHTSVTLMSSGSGQQQQASSSFETGSWSAPPQAFETSQGVVIKVYTDHGEQALQIQGSSVTLASSAEVSMSQQLPMQSVEKPTGMKPMEPMQPMQPMEPMQPMQPLNPTASDREASQQSSTHQGSREPMQPMEPMKPMKPMEMPPIKMGSMEMNRRPMEMRMGNMYMKMGHMQMGNLQMGHQEPGYRGAGPINSDNTTAAVTRRFCSQCGVPVHPNDRFCSSCGHQLA